MASAPRPRGSSPRPRVASQERENESLSPRFLRSVFTAGNTRTVLLSFDELSEWCQDNNFILRGYRPISGSAHASFCTIAFLLGGWYIPEYLASRYSSITGADFFIFTLFLLTAVICLGLSTTYHTLMNHSHDVEQLWLRLDLIGIVVLTLGDFVSGIYMVFWCEPLQREIYWSLVSQYLYTVPVLLLPPLMSKSYVDRQSGILGLLTIFIVVNPKFQGQKFRVFRALTFIATGLSGFVPLVHGVKMFGVSQMISQSGMLYYLIEGGFLLLGALIYATRFPESRYPGKFDIYGSSHQLFHILVVLAAVTQLIGILNAFDYNHVNRTCLKS
ncbi:hypothetical protein FE257_004108 [Aspergillus nanangensis]|uniref:Uncharacterized protein n=1 Tax=Aspergillus nanangensis TaxID=2582783 RepID=A0AAD4CAY2_ASPNN|nr:hypothetical protein FE257_004108 [Aspergillus nanangensis]